MDKSVKPVFPKSIEEHDKEVREAWSPSHKDPELLEIELKIRGLLNKGLFRYYIQTLISKDLYSSVDVHFHNADFYAYITTTYDMFDSEFTGGFKVKRIYVSPRLNSQERSGEIDCTTIQEVNDILCKWFDIKEEFKCKYCADGTNKNGESLFNEDILTLGGTSFLNIDVGISEDNELGLLTTNSSGDTIFHTVMKIKHCPMCGRLLDNKHEQDNLKQLMKETFMNGISEGLADAIINGDGRLSEKIEESKNLIDKFKNGDDGKIKENKNGSV